MSQPELLKAVVSRLDSAGIPYMVTGSIASSLHGEPRATHDIDIVIGIRAGDIPDLLEAFPGPEYYLSETAAVEAVRRRGLFNLIDPREGVKVDFWVLKDDPFDRSRFSRRVLEEFGGVRFHVSSPEDTILAKLRWALDCGGSEKQFRDALRVYEVQGPRLDLAYTEEWADRLDVRGIWERLKAEARPV